VNGR